MFMFNKSFKILTLYFKNYDFDLDFIFQLSGSYLINYHLRGLISYQHFITLNSTLQIKSKNQSKSSKTKNQN